MPRILIILALLSAGCVSAQAQFAPFCPGQNTNGYVVDFAIHDNQLHATGLFSRICDKLAASTARWDGSDWKPLTNSSGSSLDGGHALEIIDGDLYLAKYEFGPDSNWLIRINNNTMKKVLPGFWRTNPNPNLNQVPILYDVVQYHDQIVVCGEFDRAGNQSIAGIAAYTGNAWAPLASGLTGFIPNTYNLIAPHGMLVWNDDLYVAGNFLKAGDVTVRGVARWDGAQWHAMGEGFNRAAYGFGVLNGELYACGEFTASGNTPLQGVARWDGANWTHPGFGLGPAAPGEFWYVHTLKEIDGILYILGGFKKAFLPNDTLDCSALVAFDGNNLQVFNGGLPNLDAEAIIPFNNQLLVGGGIINGASGHLHYLDSSTAVAHPLASENIRIFPNPACDQFRIQVDEQTAWRYDCFSADGIWMQGGQLPGRGSTDLSIAAWPGGVYFIRISGEKNVLATRMLVKQK